MVSDYPLVELPENPTQQVRDLLTCLQAQQLLIVNPRRKNGLIIIKPYHAEFAGPGAAIGAKFDSDVVDILPVGKLSLIRATTSQERVKSYLIRRQWIRLAKQITDNSVPQQRAQVILNQFEHWFDAETAHQLPDEAFGLLVGVLPQTMKKVRSDSERLSCG